MNADHLDKFKKTTPKGAALCKLREEMRMRKDVFDFVKGETDIVKICDKIFHWGGIHRENQERLKQQRDKTWLEIATDIKAGKLDRVSAYAAFHRLRVGGKLKGLGPAYFTKLIYFLMPKKPEVPRGYIMDQWVGCAINILTQKDIVLMDSDYSNSWSKTRKLKQTDSYRVCDANTAEDYDRFCCLIEEIAAEISKLPDTTELLLMSRGGRKPLEWRAYVKDNRKPRYE